MEQAVFKQFWCLDSWPKPSATRSSPWQFQTHRYADPPPLIHHWQLVL